MKKIAYFYMLALVALLLPAGCDFLEIPAPKDQLVRDNVFTSDQSATAVVSGIYNGLIDASGQLGNLGVITELASGQLAYTGNDNAYIQFFENSIDDSNGIIQALWTSFYRNIYRCNAALEGLSGAVGVSDQLRNQLRGEVLAIRAFCYFYLVSLWGDVPLITGTDYRINQRVGRTPSADIQAAIAADLSEAESLLSDAYPSVDRARFNRKAVRAMQARVYWMWGDWQRAESMATSVIEDPSYFLESPETAFSLKSQETVWQLVPHNASVAYGYIPGQPDIIPRYYITAQLFSAFEANDQRRTEWIGTNIVDGVEYPYPYKYKVASGNNPVGEALIVFRIAEQYLIRAEARARLAAGTEALADVNAVRERAGLHRLATIDEPGLLAAIANERRAELFAEWGLHWLDVRRSSNEAAWPLPLGERQRNPSLGSQNNEH